MRILHIYVSVRLRPSAQVVYKLRVVNLHTPNVDTRSGVRFRNYVSVGSSKVVPIAVFICYRKTVFKYPMQFLITKQVFIFLEWNLVSKCSSLQTSVQSVPKKTFFSWPKLSFHNNMACCLNKHLYISHSRVCDGSVE